MTTSEALILLNLAGLRPRQIAQVLATGVTADQLTRFTPQAWRAFPWLEEAEVAALAKVVAERRWEQELALAQRHNIKIIDMFAPDYPALLKEIPQPPPVLYIRGNAGVLHETAVAVVGSRVCTVYGLECAVRLSRELAELGIVVVSGLARGIDTAAHQGALCRKTVAVLGSGLLHIYPAENRTLAESIAQNGAVVSEFPLTATPLKDNFPRRNRVISGLARGVVVIEAAVKSGALITANCALEQNREVFALPGPVGSPGSAGTHALIQEGAKLITGVNDILKELNLCPTTA